MWRWSNCGHLAHPTILQLLAEFKCIYLHSSTPLSQWTFSLSLFTATKLQSSMIYDDSSPVKCKHLIKPKHHIGSDTILILLILPQPSTHITEHSTMQKHRLTLFWILHASTHLISSCLLNIAEYSVALCCSSTSKWLPYLDTSALMRSKLTENLEDRIMNNTYHRSAHYVSERFGFRG